MASADHRETMAVHYCSSSIEDDDEDDDNDDVDDGLFDVEHSHPHPQNLSRLSICTSNSTYGGHDEEDFDDGIAAFMSELSIPSFDADADAELSNHEEEEEEEEEEEDRDGDLKPRKSNKWGFSISDSESDDKETVECYSLPATPPRLRRTRRNNHSTSIVGGVKEYASENEAHKLVMAGARRRRKKRTGRVVGHQKWLQNRDHLYHKDEESSGFDNNYRGSLSGESESGGRGGLMVITRPKGGKRSLCMDMEEVRACRDLGFELEHERMLETMPSRLSISVASTFDTATTSSGGNSPIANWRISSPGDDPRDVKARIKVWAQAVALASTTKHAF